MTPPFGVNERSLTVAPWFAHPGSAPNDGGDDAELTYPGGRGAGRGRAFRVVVSTDGKRCPPRGPRDGRADRSGRLARRADRLGAGQDGVLFRREAGDGG